MAFSVASLVVFSCLLGLVDELLPTIYVIYYDKRYYHTSWINIDLSEDFLLLIYRRLSSSSFLTYCVRFLFFTKINNEIASSSSFS
jgi:hypothetical protein